MIGISMLVLLALVSPVWPRPQGPIVKFVECSEWCARNYPKPATTCVLPALRGEGPCYVCGPFKTSSSEQLCNKACTDTSKDNKHCGKCGKACPAGKSCCEGACVDLQSDKNNCGACGTICPAGKSCCEGACVDLQSDNNNCGACGTICPAGQECSNGFCIQPCEIGSSCEAGAYGCPNSAYCRCITTAEGNNVCGYLYDLSTCDPPCSKSSDCGANSVCAVNLCCQPGACVQVTNYPYCFG